MSLVTSELAKVAIAQNLFSTSKRTALKFIAATFAALIFTMTAAHAQFAELNPNDPAGYNSDFNTSDTASGTIPNVGTGGGPGGWNTAQFDFDFALDGAAVWAGGVEFQLQGGVQQLWNQPRNTDFPNDDTGLYAMRFTRGVGGLTFYQGGLDNGDTVDITASYQGAPVTLLTSYFDDFSGSVSVVSNDGTTVRLLGPSSGSGNERLREYRVTFPDNVLVDRLDFTVGKGAVSSGDTVTLAFYLFDWLPLPIDAEDDIGPDVPNNADAINVLNVLTDNGNGPDTLDDPNTVATDVATTATVTVAATGAVPSGITLNADGSIDVAEGTAVGPYSIPYEICEIANPTNCATATATLNVIAPVIDAVDDDFTGTPVTSLDGGDVGNVLTNDTLDTDPIDPADTTILINSDGGLTGVTIADDGTVNVPAGTPPGPYTVTYQLCDDANADTGTNPATGNCDTATVDIQVNAPVIDAVDDDFTATAINSLDGGDAGNVLTNDTLNTDPVDPALTTILINSDGGLTGVTIADDGTLTVPPGTPAGPYTVTYQLCEDANADTGTNPATGNCDIATVDVLVTAPQIEALDNDFSAFPVNGFAGGTTTSVLGNDSYNNDPIATNGAGEPTQVTLVPGTPTNANLTMNPDGTITVAPGTPAGTYTYPYDICDDLNPLLCSSAVATVVVGLPGINAVPEAAVVVPPSTATPGALNVLTSDRINNVAATPTNVTITEVGIAYFVDGVSTPAGSIPGGLTLNTTTGAVDVDGASQAFRAEITYQICDVDNPLNCDTATETILVPPLDLEALPEVYPPVNGLTGTDGTPLISVITSDVSEDATGTVPVNLIDGDPFEVTITQIAINNNDTMAASTALSLDTATGEITVNPNTPAGEYGVTYQICLDQSAGPICRTLEELVTVTAAPIDAVPDSATGIDGNTGATDVLTVYENDTLNGDLITEAQVLGGDITLSVVTTAVPVGGGPVPAIVPVLTPGDGTVDVPAGTPAGTYEIVYEVCEALNTYTSPTPGNSNCAVTTATVVVDLPAIVAIDDDFSGSPVDGADGGPVGSIFDPAGDDTLDGTALSAADITAGAISLALETPPTPINGGPVPTLDLATGAVAVPANTPAGTYTFDYTICDTINTSGAETNCATATVTVVVDAPEILANPDSIADIDGATGQDDVLSVLGNDTLDTDPLTPADITSGAITLEVLTPATSIGGAPVPVLDPADGTVDVPAGTPQGTYVITYEVCDTLNTFGTETNCATTTATVDVQADPPVATDDVVSGLSTNTPAIVNPLIDNGNGADSDPDGTLNVGSVVFIGTETPVVGSAVTDAGKTLTVPDEGVWTIAASGIVTFAPDGDFTGDPTPVVYTVDDNDGNTSNEATITLDFDQAPPVANPDAQTGVPGVPTIVDVLGNDTDPDDDIDPTTVSFTDPAATNTDMDGDADRLEVPGQGVWTIDPDTGAITFTAEPAFTGDPDPVDYTVTDATGLTSDPASVTITYPATGTGISGIAFLDNDVDGSFDSGTDDLLSGIIVELRDPDGNLIAETVTDGSGFYEMTDFAVGQDFVLSFIDPETAEVLGTIEDLDFAIGTVLVDQNAAIAPSVPIGALEIAKNALIRDVVIGGNAPFEIIVTNTTAVEVGPVTVRDSLPVGLVYTPDTATVGGASVTPTVEGRTVSFTDVFVPANGSVTIVLQTRVTTNAPNGDIVNTAVVIDPDTGIVITDEAEATIRRRPEAVFNCSDIIGKVFDDRNMDGYQNPPADDAVLSSRGPIADFDAPLSGKFGAARIAPAREGEPGLANVRVATPTGTIITTDQYGRFSVPCAELPGAIGTNFALKVDERSLPTGYRLTTDNPLVMRVTAGSFAEMNFGAAIGRVVAIDLTDAAYQPGTADPVDQLAQGIAGLLDQVRDTPSIIRLSYFTNGETAATAGARLDAVEELITDRWATMGRYRLVIERTTKQMQ